MKIYVQRTNKRTLKICPQSDGSVLVVAYRFLSQKNIANYVAENMGWISDCLHKVCKRDAPLQCNTQPKPSTSSVCSLTNQIVKDIFSGKSTLLCGQLYKCNPSANSQTHLSDDCLYVSDKHFALKELRLKTIKSFLKKMSNSVLAQEVSRLGSIFTLCPTKIQFKDLHGRWCSCVDAEARAIILDYRLIQLPQQLQEYVISHAFAHFAKGGHGDDFFAHLGGFMPNYKDRQRAIADYDFLLDV